MEKSNLDLWIEEQKVYRFTNNLRKVTLVLSWVLTIVIFILARNEKGTIFELIFGSFLAGSIIHGSVHAEFVFKKITSELGLIIGFLFAWLFGWYLLV